MRTTCIRCTPRQDIRDIISMKKLKINCLSQPICRIAPPTPPSQTGNGSPQTVWHSCTWFPRRKGSCVAWQQGRWPEAWRWSPKVARRFERTVCWTAPFSRSRRRLRLAWSGCIPGNTTTRSAWDDSAWYWVNGEERLIDEIGKVSKFRSHKFQLGAVELEIVVKLP